MTSYVPGQRPVLDKNARGAVYLYFAKMGDANKLAEFNVPEFDEMSARFVNGLYNWDFTALGVFLNSVSKVYRYMEENMPRRDLPKFKAVLYRGLPKFEEMVSCKLPRDGYEAHLAQNKQTQQDVFDTRGIANLVNAYAHLRILPGNSSELIQAISLSAAYMNTYDLALTAYSLSRLSLVLPEAVLNQIAQMIPQLQRPKDYAFLAWSLAVCGKLTEGNDTSKNKKIIELADNLLDHVDKLKKLTDDNLEYVDREQIETACMIFNRAAIYSNYRYTSRYKISKFADVVSGFLVEAGLKPTKTEPISVGPKNYHCDLAFNDQAIQVTADRAGMFIQSPNNGSYYDGASILNTAYLARHKPKDITVIRVPTDTLWNNSNTYKRSEMVAALRAIFANQSYTGGIYVLDIRNKLQIIPFKNSPYVR